jgi:hypothetical protein
VRRAIQARIDWQPTEPYHLFSLDVTEAAFIRFTDECQHIWRAGCLPPGIARTR